jgi:hypothetical protein
MAGAEVGRNPNARRPENWYNWRFGMKLLRLLSALALLLASARLPAQSVVHLTFDNPSNLAADSSGNGRHGRANGNPTAQGAGRAGGAVALNGTSSIELGAEAAGALAGNFSVSLWVRTTQAAGSNADSAEQGAGLLFAPGQDGAPSLPVALTGNVAGIGATQSTIHSQSPINQGEWVNVVITHNADEGLTSLFVNGNLEASEHASPRAQSVHDLLLLGANPGNGLGLQGELDDFQLYDRVIPASAVAYLHANPGSALLAIPEPSTWALLACGLATFGALAWRRRHRA